MVQLRHNLLTCCIQSTIGKDVIAQLINKVRLKEMRGLPVTYRVDAPNY